MSKSTHYPLTYDEFLRLNAELKDAELRVYLHLMTLNPFPNSVMEIDTAQISERLGITRRTVQRAIKQLQELQLIEIESTRHFI
jgi:predicted transcriptional regulator